MLRVPFFGVLLLVSFTYAHMSMNQPVPRTRARISKTDCASAERSQSYLTWEWNEPQEPARPCLCHGTFQDANIRAENVIAAGTTIAIGLAGTAYHGGGHCAFWWSTDGVNYKKFLDYLDCTKRAVVDNLPINIQIPTSIDAACANRCIFAWTWIPRQSGACEIYMTCADVRITGAVGGGTPIHTMQFNPTANPSQCARVNAAGWSTSFGTVNTNGMGGGGGGGGGSPQTLSPSTTGGTAAPTRARTYVTARPTPTVTDTGSNAPPGALCLNPQVVAATSGWGPININNGSCGPGAGICDADMCCSNAGFCGPELASFTNGVPRYYQYPGPTLYSDPITAFNAYCNNGDNQADFRYVPCCSIVNGVFTNDTSCLRNFTLAGTTGAAGVPQTWMAVFVSVCALLWGYQ